MARFSGVGTPLACPSSTTPPASQRTSSGLPRSRSWCIDEVMSGETVSAAAWRHLGVVLGKATPCARPTATTSRITSSRKARVCGFERIGPMVLRIVVVVPDRPTRKTYFCQISRRMSVESSALMPPARQAASKRLAAREREPSNSPNSSRCMGPVWRITPGDSMVVAT
jgi:hypothetical protein